MGQTCVQQTACLWTAELCLRVQHGIPKCWGLRPVNPVQGCSSLTPTPVQEQPGIQELRGLCNFLPLSGTQAGGYPVHRQNPCLQGLGIVLWISPVLGLESSLPGSQCTLRLKAWECFSAAVKCTFSFV